MQKIIRPCCLLICLTAVMILSGCDRKEEDPVKKTEQNVQVQPDLNDNSNRKITSNRIEKPNRCNNLDDCHNKTDLTLAKQTWCRGVTAWKSSAVYVKNSTARKIFIRAYEQGMLDAWRGADPHPGSSNSHAGTLKEGYRQGYMFSVKSMGITLYSCANNESRQSEYEKHWCDAAAEYNKIKPAALDNPVLKSQFASGYLSGQAIALSLPSAMENLIRDKKIPNAASINAIGMPDESAAMVQKIFYSGFEAGFSAMLETVRDSVNQAMEQIKTQISSKKQDDSPENKK